jgi:mutator protein MutT
MAGALIDEAGRVLIAQRPAGKHLEGSWEFPGGKLEPGETRIAGLARELREELGVSIIEAHPLLMIRHAYLDRDVLLDIWRVRRFSGEPVGRDAQALRWCEAEDLPGADVLPADRPAIAALRLPDRLESRCGRNYEVVCATDLRAAVRGASGEASLVGASLVGASCADPSAARAAAAAGADFIVLTAVLPAETVKTLCGAINLPVYCSGIELARAWEIGARGIVVAGAGAGQARLRTP